MTETPTEQVVKKANKAVSFKDADGREIVIKKLSAMDEYNLCKIVGKAQQNEGQFMMLMTVYHLVSIDGEAVHKGSMLQLEALIQKTGDGFQELAFQVMKLRAEDMVDAQELQEQIKNLLPDQTP